jgi:hypothetical protein
MNEGYRLGDSVLVQAWPGRAFRWVTLTDQFFAEVEWLRGDGFRERREFVVEALARHLLTSERVGHEPSLRVLLMPNFTIRASIFAYKESE